MLVDLEGRTVLMGEPQRDDGEEQEGDRRRSRAAAFDAHLVKPVDPDALREAVEDLIEEPAGDSSLPPTERFLLANILDLRDRTVAAAAAAIQGSNAADARMKRCGLERPAIMARPLSRPPTPPAAERQPPRQSVPGPWRRPRRRTQPVSISTSSVPLLIVTPRISSISARVTG